MDEFPESLGSCRGFDWDASNAAKNWRRHRVSQAECEQVFFNRPFLAAPDLKHSDAETRLAGLGQTSDGRRVAVVFTIRRDLVRVIMARDMSRRERRLYARAEEAGQAEEAE